MAAPHVVSQLRAKRDALQDAVAYLEAKLAQARADLMHVNGTLRLFETEGEDGAPRPSYLNLNRMFAPRETLTLSLAALKARGASMTTRELAAYIVEAKGWDTRDPALARAVAHRITHILTKAKARGQVASPGYEKGVRVWVLSGPAQ